jgi:predicted PurR-regulated permease PerM
MNVLTSERVQAAQWIGLGIGLLVLMYVLAPVLTPFAFGAVLAYLLIPGVDWLARHRIPRSAAALAVMIALGLVVVALLLILVPVLRNELIALQEQLPRIVPWLNGTLAPKLQAWLGVPVNFDAQSLRELLAEQAGGNPDLVKRVLESVRVGGLALVGVVGLLLLVPVVLFYFLMDGHAFVTRLEAAIPRRWHPRTVQMVTEIDALLAQFLRGQLTVMLVLAGYYAIALSIARFDAALPIGLLTGLLVFIPYVGFGLGLLLAVVAALLQFGPLYGLTAVAVVYGIGQLLESFALTPRLVGERIGLHPLAVIFALLAFGQVFGFLGVLLALPVSAALLVAVRHTYGAYLASDFYGRS